MARGRKPTPDHLKALKGNPGKREIRQAIESGILRSIPRPPDHLSDAAKTEWRRLAPVLHDTGRLTKASLRFFERYCFAYHVAKESEETLIAEGYVLDHDNKGKFQHPAWYQWKQATELMAKLSAGFGLMPVDALRFQSEKTAEKGNPFAAFGGAA